MEKTIKSYLPKHIAQEAPIRHPDSIWDEVDDPSEARKEQQFAKHNYMDSQAQEIP